MLLADDVAELRIGRKGRRLIKDGFAHRGLHGIACLVVAQIEVPAYFRICHVPKAGRTESAVGEERRKCDQGEMVRGKHIERIPQKLVGPCPEVVEPPVPLENFCNFGNGEEVWGFLFNRVESHRHDGIGGINDNELLAHVPVFPPFAGVDPSKEERRGVAVEIEVDEAPVLFDVLLAHIAQEVALAAAGLPKNDHMPHALAARERQPGRFHRQCAGPSVHAYHLVAHGRYIRNCTSLSGIKSRLKFDSERRGSWIGRFEAIEGAQFAGDFRSLSRNGPSHWRRPVDQFDASNGEG